MNLYGFEKNWFRTHVSKPCEISQYDTSMHMRFNCHVLKIVLGNSGCLSHEDCACAQFKLSSLDDMVDWVINWFTHSNASNSLQSDVVEIQYCVANLLSSLVSPALVHTSIYLLSCSLEAEIFSYQTKIPILHQYLVLYAYIKPFGLLDSNSRTKTKREENCCIEISVQQQQFGSPPNGQNGCLQGARQQDNKGTERPPGQSQ